MVKRFAVYWIILLVLLGALLSGLYWLWYTPQGARWILGQVTQRAPLAVGRVEGSLSKGLQLDELNFQGKGLSLKADHLAISWNAWPLLYGRADINSLTARGVRIEDNRPATEEPPTFRVPELPGWLVNRSANIDRLHLEDLNYSKAGKPVYHLAGLDAQARMRNGVLQVSDLRMQDQFGRIQGRLRAGLKEPLLETQGRWLAAKSQAVNEVYWSVDWRQRDAEALAGPIHLVMRDQDRTLGALAGDWAIDPHAIRLQQTRLSWSGLPGPLWANGRLDFPKGKPFADMQSWADWQLAQLSPQLEGMDLAWHLKARGWLEGFQGSLQAVSRGKDWQNMQVSGPIRGDSSGFQSLGLKGQVLGGTLASDVSVSVKPQPDFRVEASFRDLDPGLYNAAVPGSLNGSFLLQGGGKGFADQGQLALELAPSRLHQQPLQGAVRASWMGKDLLIQQARIYGRGVELAASGRISKGLRVRANVNDLGRLAQGATGRVNAEGLVQFRPGLLSARLQGQGSNLGFGALKVQRAAFQARMQNGMTGPVSLTLSLRDLGNQTYRINTVNADMAGTLARQDWQMRAAWPEGSLGLAMQARQLGKSLAGPWRFGLQELNLRDRQTGAWQLAKPVAITLDPASRINVPNLLLVNQGTGQLSLNADIRLKPLSGSFDLRMRQVPILPIWFPPSLNLLVQGQVSGGVQGRMLANQQLQVQGNVALGQGRLRVTRPQGQIDAVIETARSNFTWSGNSVRGDVQLNLVDYGQANARFELPLLAQVPPRMLPTGPLRVTGDFRVSEKGMLLAAMPGVVQEGRGDLRGNVDIGGTWQNPRLGGQVRLTGAAAFVPSAGVYVTDIGGTVTLQGDTLQISGIQARSGDGMLTGSGVVNLQGFKPVDYRLQISGRDFRAVDLPEVKANVSPDLQIGNAGDQIQIRGTVRVPYLRVIGTQPGGLRPSSDVVYVDEKKAASSGSRIDLLVTVILGDDVRVEAQGASARLGGELRVSMQGSEEPQAHGSIKVLEGRYAEYGQDLRVQEGTITFAGPLMNPSLNVLVARKVDEILAGIRITGVWPKPRTELVSEPPMQDAEVLSYIVLGRPLTGMGGGGESSLLARAAGGLLSLGEAAKLQKNLQSGLGLDKFELETGGSFDQFMVTMGKYVNPRIYVSIGQALFSQTTVLRGRYKMTRNWELQVESGTQQSNNIDLLYSVEMR
ncbi:translocation/assembly module TamB domain-containing protein [Thermithiobacillus plumbiphilus]|uniref:Translocation/assembly module TamB domain-containing protein n=1 Tax=Thermithiobacillus plumbiphilus TaxID=1729899 RepID=A0ABU9D915_9PROT